MVQCDCLTSIIVKLSCELSCNILHELTVASFIKLHEVFGLLASGFGECKTTRMLS